MDSGMFPSTWSIESVLKCPVHQGVGRSWTKKTVRRGQELDWGRSRRSAPCPSQQSCRSSRNTTNFFLGVCLSSAGSAADRM